MKLEHNSCMLRIPVHLYTSCKHWQLRSKFLTENCKRNLELVRLCYMFLVQPSFSLKQFWQQKENALLSLQIHQQFLLLASLWNFLRTEKDLKDFFKKEGYIPGYCFLEASLSRHFACHFPPCAYQHIDNVAQFCGFGFWCHRQHSLKKVV